MSDPAADRTAAARAGMIELLDAVIAAEDRRQSLSWRIDAKMAHATLLGRATFNDDPQDAAWARVRAADAVRACAALLIS